MKVIERVTKDAINCEVKKYVCPKAKAITDGKRSYRDLSRMLMSHQEIICRDNKEVSKIFPWAHIAISNAKKMCLGIHHGIDKMFMQNYLKEFCYKFNCRYFGVKLFHRLMIAAVDSPWYAFRLSHGWSIIKSIMVKNQFLLSATLFTIIFFSLTSHVNAQANIDIESGAVFTGYNNVKISGDAGTLFSLKTDLNAKPNAFIRIRAGYKIKSRHTISLLYAPLIVKSNGTTNKQIDFEGVTFPSNTALNASYKFNSYRITYRYDIIKRSKFQFGLGFTAKIRDAEVALNSEGLTASKKNVGFVPIINFRLN